MKIVNYNELYSELQQQRRDSEWCEIIHAIKLLNLFIIWIVNVCGCRLQVQIESLYAVILLFFF